MTPSLVPESELHTRARAAWEASGLTQREVAAALGVSQPTLSQALNDPKRSLSDLRIRIIERYGDTRVSGPLYQLDPSSSSPS
ncbi:helix-turn-helix domain-containing protein [Rubrivirga litoralis]|uniref:Helix-turn-helix transcriptional regulator n=1 Tax=Rubrivirga litoralis TaxID=3075598 RepID=A0ABU3BUG4_9BACT|nr:helix-turn-helix transcriptional regulator [Rubrivirga sp. F394]MDT0632926.1 helix-turn-helix transcriptional regulator [Rubrivirga sp. F394]